jgi:hypothetical protein
MLLVYEPKCIGNSGGSFKTGSCVTALSDM